MSALFVEGCDLYGTDLALTELYGWTRVTADTALSATAGRFGGGAFAMFDDPAYWQYAVGKADVTTCFCFTALIYPNLIPDTDWGVIRWMNNTTVACGRVDINSAFQVVIKDAGGTIQATSAGTYSVDNWHAMQTKIVVHASAGSIEVWMNGEQAALATGIDTLPLSGNGSVEIIRFGSVTPGAGFEYRDDLCAWDDSGSDWNDWTSGKDLRIDTIRPNADTAQEDFTPKSAGDQFAEINDDPAHDVDASYNESAVLGDKDRVGLETISGTPIAIYDVRTRLVIKKTDAGAANVKCGVYAGATEGVSAAQGLSTDYGFRVHDEEINPDDSLPWEKADIDALQLQYEHA